SVGADLPAGAFRQFALPGGCEQRRIRIIDMQKYLPVDSEIGKRGNRAVFARHRDMPHAPAGLGAKAGGDQFVITPHRAVEEDERRGVEQRFQFRRDCGAGGEKIETPAGSLVADAKAERVAGAVIAAGMRLALEIPGALAGHGEGKDLDPACRAVGQGGLERPIDPDRYALHVVFAQHVENAVRLQDRQHFRMGIDRKRRAFAHRKQARDRVDLAVGQDYASDRRMAERPKPRMKLGGRYQLLAEVGGGVDEEPVPTVGAECDRGLRALQLRMVVSRGPAHLASAIPLRNAAARRGAQDDDAEHDPSPGDSLRDRSELEDTRKPQRWPSVRARPPYPGTCRARRSTLSDVKIRSAYLRVALTYMLISMPQGTSTIFGAFQAILALLGINGRPAVLGVKLACDEKFASEFFPLLALLRCSVGSPGAAGRADHSKEGSRASSASA